MLSSLATPLKPGAVVVDLHASPNLLWPSVQTAGGLALIAGALLLFQRERRRSPSDALEEAAGFPLESYPSESAAATASPDANVMPAEAPVMVRGLLLLNLGPDAGSEEIEYAPPLGRRDETIRQIRRAIPGMQFDGRGRGMLRGGGFLVIVDVGLDDPAYSAIAGAEGAPGVEALERLLAETGWRAYVPRAGAYWGGRGSVTDSRLSTEQEIRRSRDT
jgi:hypothetical protein